jgi:hypothetical protein
VEETADPSPLKGVRDDKHEALGGTAKAARDDKEEVLGGTTEVVP